MGRWFWWAAVLLTTLAPPSVARAQPSPPAGAIRQKTAEVFDRPEFRPEPTGASNWLVRQLRAFFEWLGDLHATAPALYWLFLAACAAGLVLLVTLIVLQLRSLFVAGDRTRAARAGAEARRHGLAAAYRAEADRKAAAGDYTEAIRFLFLSLVYRFDERGQISFHKAYTNREYLDLLGDRLPGRDGLRVLVDTLDDHWYGQRPCRLPQYEACLGVYERLAAAT